MINTDTLTRRLYSADASMYEEMPEGVAFPKTLTDIRDLVLKANKEHFTITPRSAGTSLAGQATGGGVIMDVSRYMTDILEINAEEHYAVVQSGVIRDTLNRETGPYNLFFGPDTSTTNRCMMGGMIGNNSCGSYSIKYKTTREHVLEMEVVLSDGSIATFKPLTLRELEEKKLLQNMEGHIYRSTLALLERNRETIISNYPHPEIVRRNTGYALDRLLEMQPFTPNGRLFNLCELLCGSEGTLATTVTAKVNLVEKQPLQILVIPHFTSLHNAMVATNEAVKFGPSAVELIDDIILNATKGNIEQNKNRFFLQGEPKCILAVQFEGKDQTELLDKATRLADVLRAKNLSYAFPVITESAKMNRVWELRKAGLGLLMGLGKDSRSPTFTEDTAVRVIDLPDYVRDFQEILKKYNKNSVFYAHASVGELHIRPIIDITNPKGLETMKNMASDIADLVRSYRGTLSGEHGDGRARAPFIEKVLGREVMPLLRQTKEIWDPNYIFNPGKIIEAKPMDADLRFSPDYIPPKAKGVFNWRKEGSFADALEFCNGAGVCRKLAESGGTMCPSYMATKDEKSSTRGRANVFRQVFSGANPEEFASEDLRQALDLCLSCKACKSECPANVDMAKMKAEFLNGWHKKHGLKLKERFFGDAGKMYPLGGTMPGIANKVLDTFFAKKALENIFGIDTRRELPRFANQVFTKWYKEHSKNGAVKSADKVVLFVDLFTNYNDPDVAIAAISVLEKMGYQVELAEINQSGRPQLSKGMLDDAKAVCENAIPVFYKYAIAGLPIIGLEPSELLTLRDEFLDLCDDTLLPQAKVVAIQAYLFEEFVASHKDRLPKPAKKQKVVLHGHCHAKSLVGNEPTVEALEAAGYEVETLQTGCCGMAGSFGYEKDHYDVSMEIGELILFPKLREKEEGTVICAPGFSCRHQIKDGTGLKGFHPAELICQAIME